MFVSKIHHLALFWAAPILPEPSPRLSFFSIFVSLCFEIIGPSRFCEFLMLVIASPCSLLAVI